jgi:xylan 1,4-beta-xylosidase
VKKTGEQGFAPETVSICYSLDGAEYVTAGSMQAVPGRWVGVKNGVFCIRRAAGSGGFLTVESVQYERHFARTYSNPVQRGFFPDPSVVRVGEDYYMVNSTFQYFPAIAISHSRDMVHWELIGHAITNPDDLDLQDIRDSHGIWAPDISYDNGKFIIMATLRLNADGKRNNNVMRRQLVMTSERPEGPYSRPACLEVDSIDPSHFVDDDGKHYMVISPGINLVPLSDDCTRVVGDVIPVWQGTGERCPEGPHILRHGEYYYAILAEGGTGYGHGINVGRSRNLFGPYEASPYNPLMRQTDPQAPIQRTGHGKLIETHNGDWWVYYLMGRPNQGHYTTIGRETGMDPVTWLPDGWFVINDRKGPSLTQIAPDLPECSYPKWSRDDFDREILDVHWEFVRNPAPGSYSLTQRPGYFRIWTRDGQLNEIRAKNTLLRREQELCYEACTKVEFYPSKNGEQAGLTCYYSTATYARFCICYEEGRKLQLVINRNHGEELMAEVCDIREQAVYLKVVVEHLTRTFYYSYDGTEWIEAGVLKDCIYLCDEGVPDDPKRHTGTLVGIYANNGGCGSRIPADFDFFEYKD